MKQQQSFFFLLPCHPIHHLPHQYTIGSCAFGWKLVGCWQILCRIVRRASVVSCRDGRVNDWLLSVNVIMLGMSTRKIDSPPTNIRMMRFFVSSSSSSQPWSLTIQSYHSIKILSTSYLQQSWDSLCQSMMRSGEFEFSVSIGEEKNFALYKYLVWGDGFPLQP